MDAVRAYLLDLCDAALEEAGERDAELEWLREGGSPIGPAATVDGWYPGASLVVVLPDGRGRERSRDLARVAAGYGVDVLELPASWVARDAAGTPRRLPAERAAIARVFADPDSRRRARVDPDAFAGAFAAEAADVDDEDWEDDEWEDEAWLDDEDGRPPTAMRPETELDSEPAIGWRGRAVTLALLEAVRLTRRAFAVDRAGPGLGAGALEVLLVLFVAAQEIEPAEIERLLARYDDEVARAFAELEAAGHAEAVEWAQEEDPLWTLTASGEQLAEAWIARVAPLFGRWPPDVPGVDDAGGPGPS